MDIFLVEDDINVIKVVTMIIKNKNLGNVIGYSLDGNEGEQQIKALKPDVVMVDLLMPGQDGITLVDRCKSTLKNTQFIMVSQVTNKEMISKAYESGIEFYINKPINAIEVETVLRNIIKSIEMNRTLNKIQNIIQVENDTSLNVSESEKFLNNMHIINNEIVMPEGMNQVRDDDNDYIKKLKNVMRKIGIMGEVGSDDIIRIIEYLITNKKTMSDYAMKDLCAMVSDNPKSIEQRIRRTANIGMSNLCNMGIEDYNNEVFMEFSNGLYNFHQVKREMDYIRGVSKIRGKISIKKFMNGLVFYCEK